MVDLKQALNYIDPSGLNYEEWLEIGMGLKSAANDGHLISWQDWDSWSQKDPARYQPGVCEKKWYSFKSSGISKATVIYQAMQSGFQPFEEVTGLEWDAEIDDGVPPTQDTDFLTYIRALFDKEDQVSIVTHAYLNDNGKYNPGDSGFHRSANDLIGDFVKYDGEIENIIGDYNHDAGVWVRMNPVDGQGVSNNNITKFKYTLIESDETDRETQLENIYKLRLPCAAIVDSGGRSIHAIVKVEAEDLEEYNKRVQFIHKTLEKQNIRIDKQNKNAARLTRLPGVNRGKEKQTLIDIHTGYNSFSAWQEYVLNDFNEIVLPEIVTLKDVLKNPPDLSPVLIDGILRQGHKLLLTGPSKAGKSFMLIELGLSLADGSEWLGRKCKKAKVLYINLEIDEASFSHRVINVMDAHGMKLELPENFSMLHLRGKAQPMFKLTPKLIDRIKPDNYDVIILDPVYKVQSGDENAAGDIARFTNEFDKLTTDLGVSMIYCHHHSKGNQGGKRAVDRGSGSGVFARDPDAILDMIELENKTFKTNEKLRSCTAWRIEATLREFPPVEPINVFFKHPVHVVDTKGLLKDAEYKNYTQFQPKQRTTEDVLNELDECFECLTDNGEFVNEEAMLSYFDIGIETFRKKIQTYNRLATDYTYKRSRGKVFREDK